MAVSTKLKAAFLDDAWDAAPQGDGGLRQQLRAFETSARKSISAGSIASISSDGQSHTYSTSGLSQEEVVELWRDLITLHDRTKAQLESAAQTDENIYTEMCALLASGGATEWETDFSGVCR
ncbi:MAG: hypothetical protein QM813_26315 [Verrucomicrobiota bacterium]